MTFQNGNRAAAAALILASAICMAPAANAQTADLQRVDPELRAVAIQRGASAPLTDAAIKMARAAPPTPAPTNQDPPFYEKRIKGLPGEPDVLIYVVNAKPGQSRPGILHVHGGGYVAGSAAQYLPMQQKIAKTLDVTIVTVDYRLAPETTYKGSVGDNYAGLKWMHDHASELGVDVKRLAVMGESAGGGHAALLALEARKRGEVPLAAEVLLYPMLDDRTGSSRPAAASTGQLVWTAPNNRYGWRSFLGMEPGTDKVPTEAVPARVKNLAGLPSTYIAVGDIDLFAEEDIAYAQRLVEAGVPVELHIYPGGYHGFNMLVPDAAVSKQFDAALLDALRRTLQIPR